MILLSIFLLTIFGNDFGQTSESSVYKIIGGEYVNGNQYPFMASLQLNGHHTCGGSIINNYYILTAAHCIQDINSNTINQLKVVVGTNDLNSANRKIYDVARTIYPGNYNPEQLIFDVGLVRTSAYIVFNSNVKPIALDANFINDNTPATVIGWGRTQTNGNTSTFLKRLNVNIQFTNCNFNNFRVEPYRHIGTFREKGQGACFGDSGSPLIANGRQIGVFSFMSNPCATGNCDVFSRVSFHLSWIQQNAV